MPATPLSQYGELIGAYGKPNGRPIGTTTTPTGLPGTTTPIAITPGILGGPATGSPQQDDPYATLPGYIGEGQNVPTGTRTRVTGTVGEGQDVPSGEEFLDRYRGATYKPDGFRTDFGREKQEIDRPTTYGTRVIPPGVVDPEVTKTKIDEDIDTTGGGTDEVVPSTGGGVTPPEAVSSCFLSGTMILVDGNKQKEIQNIKVGEYIVSYNEKTKSNNISKVLKKFSHDATEHLVFNDSLNATSNHPVLLNGKWVEIGTAHIGDTLKDSKNNDVAIKSIKKVTQPSQVYNLEVEGTHTYYADGILVHNKMYVPPPPVASPTGAPPAGAPPAQPPFTALTPPPPAGGGFTATQPREVTFGPSPTVPDRQPWTAPGTTVGTGETDYWLNQLKTPIDAQIGLSDQERRRLSNVGRAQIQGSTKAMMDEFTSAAGGRGFRAGESGLTDTGLSRIAQGGVSALSGYESNLAINEANNRFGQNMALNQANLARMQAGGGLAATQLGIGTQRDLGMAGIGAQYDVGMRGLDTQLTGMGIQRDLATAGLGQEQYRTDVGRELGLGGLQEQRYGTDVARELGLGGLDVQRYGIDVGRDVGMAGVGAQRYGAELGRDVGMAGVGAQRYGYDTQRDIAGGALGLGKEQLDLSRDRFGLDVDKFGYGRSQEALQNYLNLYGGQQQQQQQQYQPWWNAYTGGY